MHDTKPRARRRIRTLLADDHRIFLEGLRSVLSGTDQLEIDICAVAHTGDEAIALLGKERVDLLILDLDLPGRDGLQVIQHLQLHHSPVKILVLTYCNDQVIVEKALQEGAKGYALKSQSKEELMTAIQQVMADQLYQAPALLEGDDRNGIGARRWGCFSQKHQLTRRESEVLRLIARGLSSKDIAKKLFISDQTVGVHRKNIMRKLDVSNTAGLVRFALEVGLV